jgi:predicted RNA-binding protein with PIN domain
VANREVYIVDGYNVLHALFPGVDVEELFARRDWLAGRLASFAALHGARALLVFDGHGPADSTCTPVKGAPVEVCYAGGAYTADTLIARRIAERPADESVIVVSADQEVQRTAARAGVRRMTPHELGLEMNNPAQALDSSSEDSRMRSRLEDKVDLETLRKLERLRRPDQ